MEIFAPYFSVFTVSMVKFLIGPAIGPTLGLNFFETVFFSNAGLMTTVLSITSLGPGFRSWIKKTFSKNKKRFSKRNRRFVKLWRKYGIAGVCFLTPVLLSPIVGTLLVNTFGGSFKQIATYMLLSGLFWAILLASFSSYVVKLFGLTI